MTPENQPEFTSHPIEPRPAQQVPSPTVSNSSSKLPLLFSMLLVILLIGGGGYYLGQKSIKPAVIPSPLQVSSPSATPDLTADWETYTNPELGVSFKYPKTLFPESVVNEKGFRSIRLVDDLSRPGMLDVSICQTYPSGYFSVNFYRKTDKYDSLKTFASRGNRKTEPVTVNGISGFADKGNLVTYIEDDDEYISFFHCSLKEFDQILSTFQFLDNQTNTSNWKTYKFTGFSISIPSTMQNFKCDQSACWSMSSVALTGARIASIFGGPLPDSYFDTDWEKIISELNKENVDYKNIKSSLNCPQECIEINTNKSITPFLGSTYSKGILIKLPNGGWSSLFIYRYNGKFESIQITNEDEEFFDQILSTFKFL